MDRFAWASVLVVGSLVGCGGIVVFDDDGNGGAGGSGSGGFPSSSSFSSATNAVSTNVSVVTTGVSTGGSTSAVCSSPDDPGACGECINNDLGQGFCNDELEELTSAPNANEFFNCTENCGGDGPECCNGCLLEFPQVEAPYARALSCLACSQNCYAICRPLSDALCFQ